MKTVAGNAKKSLGQNFLVDEKVIRRIAEAVPMETDFLLEIGPGKGALSKELFSRCKQFYLLEKDDRFAAAIGTYLFLHGSRQHEVFHADALEFDWPKLWPTDQEARQVSIVGNLPYNVATEILFQLLEWESQIPLMVLMFQKEVAERIVAGHGSKAFSQMSVAAQLGYEAKLLERIPPGAFRPVPKVHSAVVELKRRKQPLLGLAPGGNRKAFLAFVKQCFAHRRKTVVNSLSQGTLGGQSIDAKEVQSVLGQLDLPLLIRAEQLTIEQMHRLFQGLRPD
jgi:16S rRNA (adenine1518-N6/adenine1519-N6)-dimethyltransferase